MSDVPRRLETERLVLRAWSPEVPVLFSSGVMRPELGMDDARCSFLAKPYRPQALADRVTELLGGGPEP